METYSKTSFAQILNDSIDAKLLNISTAIPGIISEYDSKTQTATVTVAAMRCVQDANGKQEKLSIPPLKNVPVMFPRTTNAIIHLPLKVGDAVLLICCHRSIDNYLDLEKAAIYDPNDIRKFSLNDAIAIPGIFPGKQKFPDLTNDALTIKNNDSTISLTDDGNINITNGKLTFSISNLGKLTIKNDTFNLTEWFLNIADTLALSAPIIDAICKSTLQTQFNPTSAASLRTLIDSSHSVVPPPPEPLI